MIGGRLPGLSLRCVLLLGGFVASVQLHGQEPLGLKRRQATRPELEAGVRAADSLASYSDERTRQRLLAQSASIRQRLANGDFVPGDRLYITVLGDSLLTDTFTVKQDQRLALPNIPDITLRGVLDSELTAHLTRELSRYLRDPRVTATALIRVQVSGGVARPGFPTVPIDQLISDVLMAQGGPTQGARLDHAHVRRANKAHLDRKQLSEALRVGMSVGDLALRDGDEIVVPVQAPGGRWTSGIWPVLTSLTGIFWLLQSLRGRGAQ